jgi:hypothetical protein
VKALLIATTILGISILGTTCIQGADTGKSNNAEKAAAKSKYQIPITKPMAAKAKLLAKLKNTRIISFEEEGNIESLAKALADESSDKNSSINIIYLGVSESHRPHIEIAFTDISLYDALGYICEKASLLFRIDTNAVVLMPNDFAKDLEVEKKLRKIIINNIEFDDVSIQEAVRSLFAKSKQLGGDINIFCQSNDNINVSFVANNINLYDAIKYLTIAAGLDFAIDNNNVLIFPSSNKRNNNKNK